MLSNVVGTDHQLWYRASGNGTTYTPWRKVPYQEPASTHPQYTNESPALVAAAGLQGHLVFFKNQATGRLTLLAMCCGSDTYTDLEGRLTSAPAGAWLAGGATPSFTGIDVGARGTDNRIWMRTYRGGTWSPWRTW